MKTPALLLGGAFAVAAPLLASSQAFAHPHDFPPSGRGDKDARVRVFSTVRGGRLGVHVQSMSTELRGYFGAPEDRGILVSKVVEDSPAAKAGFKAGDVILEVDGDRIADHGDLVRAVSAKPAGSEVMLTVLRDKKKSSLTAKLGDEPQAEGPGGVFELGDDHFRFEMSPFFKDSKDQEKRIEELEKRIEKLEKSRR